MSTPDERVEARVEVTPELLARTEEAIERVLDMDRDIALFHEDMEVFRDLSTPHHVRALVQRIRELENEVAKTGRVRLPPTPIDPAWIHDY